MTHKEAVHIVLDSFNDIPQPIKLLNDAYTYLLDYFDRPENVTLEEIKFHCEDYIRMEKRISFPDAREVYYKQGRVEAQKYFQIDKTEPICGKCLHYTRKECPFTGEIDLPLGAICKCNYFEETKE